MELLQIILLLLSLIPAAYLYLDRLALRKNSSNTTTKFGVRKSDLPPGSRGWPLIGESLDYYSKIGKGLTYEFVTERWNQYSSNVFRTSLIGEAMVIFSSAEGFKFLFSNEKKLVQLWWPTTFDKIFPKTNNMPSSEHSYTLRKILQLMLKVDVLRGYVGVIDEAMKKHLQRDWSSKQMTVCNAAKGYVFSLSCNIFLGINDQRKIEELAKRMDGIECGINSMPIDLPGMTFNRAIKAANFIQKELEATIRQRRIILPGNGSSLRKDLISHMLLATDENGQSFCDKDIASHLTGFLLASYSSLYSTITNIMKYLAEFPDVYDSAFREQKAILDAKEPNQMLTLEDIWKMKYSWSVACEVLRIATPGTGNFKEAITDFTYQGYTIPKGSKIHLIFASTHKNPKYFPDPEKFDPSRFQGNGPTPFAFVPFGGGPRMCPGNEYARVVILVYLHNVVTKFRWEKLIPGEKFLQFPAPRPAEGLPVILHHHKS